MAKKAAAPAEGGKKHNMTMVYAIGGGGVLLLLLLAKKGGGGGGVQVLSSGLQAQASDQRTQDSIKQASAQQSQALNQAMAGATRQQEALASAQQRQAEQYQAALQRQGATFEQQVTQLGQTFSAHDALYESQLNQQRDQTRQQMDQLRQLIRDTNSTVALHAAPNVSGPAHMVGSVADQIGGQVNRAQGLLGAPLPAGMTASPVGNPAGSATADNIGGHRPASITDQAIQQWWSGLGGGRSYGGPLSGPRGNRVHSSDVNKFVRQNGRLPASPTEFLNWFHGTGGRGH